MKSNTKTNLSQNIGRILLGLMLLFAGIGHLTWSRAEFLAQVPHWVSLDADLVIVLSGIAEIAFGIALLIFLNWHVWVGIAVTAFFIIISPGNISQYINGVDAFGLNSDQARGIRLLFQPLLVVWALWSTGAWKALRNK